MRQLSIATSAVVLLCCLLAVTIAADSRTNRSFAITLDKDDFQQRTLADAGWRIYNADLNWSCVQSKQTVFINGASRLPAAMFLRGRWQTLGFSTAFDSEQIAFRGAGLNSFSNLTFMSGPTPEDQRRHAQQTRLKEYIRYGTQPQLANPVKPTLITLYMSRGGAFSKDEKAGEEEEEEKKVISEPAISFSDILWGTIIIVGLLYLLAELEEIEDYEMHGNLSMQRLYAPAGIGPTIRISHGLP